MILHSVLPQKNRVSANSLLLVHFQKIWNGLSQQEQMIDVCRCWSRSVLPSWDLVDDCLDAFSRKCLLQSANLKKHTAQAPKVGCVIIHRDFLQCLWRHVGWSATLCRGHFTGPDINQGNVMWLDNQNLTYQNNGQDQNPQSSSVLTQWKYLLASMKQIYF